MLLKGFLIILLLSSLVTTGSSEGLLDTLKKGVTAVKTFVGKIFKPSREEICKDSSATDRLSEQISNLQCLQSFARKLGQHEMYINCWDRYNKIPHPVTFQQWADFYCRNDHQEMYKNIADHCFLRQLALNGTIFKQDFGTVKKCTSMLSIVYDSMGIRPDESRTGELVNETLSDRGSGEKNNSSSRLIDCSSSKNAKLFYCRKSYKPAVSLCSKKRPNEVKIAKDLKEWSCYETTLQNSPQGMQSLRECWNLTTGTEYPADGKAFQNFVCTFPYPHAYRSLIKECMEELNQITYKDMKAVKQNCRKDFYTLSDIVASQELKHAFRDQISARAREKMCATIDPEKYIASPTSNRIKCYSDKLAKGREISVLNYCFSIGSLEGKDIPVENRQWFDYQCPKNFTYLQALSQDKVVLDCFDSLMEESKIKSPEC